MQSRKELNAYRTFVAMRLGLDVSTCDRTRETAWVHLAHRLMESDAQARPVLATA